METKQCSVCKEHKPLTDYYKQTRSPDGRRSMCKQCSKSYYKKYREDNGLTGKSMKKTDTEVDTILNQWKPIIR